MRHTSFIGSLLLASAACVYVGCGSSDDSTNGGAAGETSSAGGSAPTAGGATATGGAAGANTTGGSNATGGSTAGGANTAGGAPAGGSGTAGGASAGGKAAGGSTSGGNASGGNASGGSTNGGGNSGGASAGLTPILCPETNPLTPVNPNTVLVVDQLTADTEWTADKVYVVSVPEKSGAPPGLNLDGFKLIIDAGTIVCFDTGNGIGVGNDDAPGEIDVNGTADKPVIFTALPSTQDATKPNAYHGGIAFGSFQGSTRSNLAIWYGGPGGGEGAYAVRVEDTAVGTTATKPLLLDHVTIGQVEASGIYIGNALGIDPASSVHFLGYAAHDSSSADYNAIAQVDFSAAKSLQTALTIDAGVPAAAAHILLRTDGTGTVGGPADLYDLGYPYFAPHDGFGIYGGGAVLTIHEGTTLALDGLITVGDFETDAKGDIVLAGSAAKPVVLTSLAAAPAAGDWDGIQFINGEWNPGTTKIDQAQILYAGVLNDPNDPPESGINYCDGAGVGAIMIQGPVDASAYPGPSITNTTIAHSLSDGIVAGANHAGATLSTDYTQASLNITFTDIKNKNIEAGPCPAD